jgi:hypothetical protein
VLAEEEAQKPRQTLTGQILLHYRIEKKIGEGGMGEVYRVRDTRLERTVALKILPPAFASEKDRMRRFIQEAKAASGLSHPNVATIYEVGESGGVHFIAMDNALLVGGFQPFCDLAADLQGFVDRQWTLGNSLGQRFTSDQFHDEEGLVRVTERCPQLGFTLKPGQPFGIADKHLRQYFDGHLPVKVSVLGSVYFAHTACAEFIYYPIVRNSLADNRESHQQYFSHCNQNDPKWVPL